MARSGDAPRRQRPLVRLVRGGHARALGIHRGSMGRSLRLVARGTRQEVRGGAGRDERVAGRGGHDPEGSRGAGTTRRSPRVAPGPRVPAGGPGRAGTEGRGGAGRDVVARDGGATRPLGLHHLLADALDRRRTPPRALQHVVRAVSPLGGPGRRPQRHVRRRGAQAAGHRGDGVRRPVPAADPPDRPQLPEGAEQRARRRPQRSREPVGDRRAGGRPHRDRARIWARCRTSTGSWPRRSASGSRSRSTWPSSPRPIIPGCANTPSGSAIAPTAPSSTPRTRRRSTRTSSRSTSSRPTGARSGRRWPTSSSSGSATACGSSASTTRTRSRSGSGSG